MTTQIATPERGGLLTRLSPPAFWGLTLCLALLGAATLFVVFGLVADAITTSPWPVSLCALTGGLIGFVVPILQLRRRRIGRRETTERIEPSMGRPIQEGVSGPTAAPSPRISPTRRSFLDKFTDLNFKTSDGVTHFFKYGALSRGIVVSDSDALELRRCIRRYYLWCGGLLSIGSLLFGPMLPFLMFPALTIPYLIDINDIVAPPPRPDRIRFGEHLRRLSTTLPGWLLWMMAIGSGAFVAIGCWALVYEALEARRALAIGLDYDDAGTEIISGILFFGCCLGFAKAMINIRARHIRRA